MKCDLSKELLISFIYHEVSKSERETVKAHLAKCSSCRQEVETLSTTSATLEEWKDEPVPFQLRFEPTTPVGFWQAAKQFLASLSPTARRTGMAMGILSACLLMLSIGNFKVQYNSNGFSAGFRLLPAIQSQSNELPQDFASFRQATLDSVTKMIQASEKRQRQDRNQKLTNFARAYENQRNKDLQLLGEGLDVFQTFNEQRFETTERQLRRADKMIQRIMTIPESNYRTYQNNGLDERK